MDVTTAHEPCQQPGTRLRNGFAVGPENTEGHGPCWACTGEEDQEETLCLLFPILNLPPRSSLLNVTGTCQEVGGRMVGGVRCRAGMRQSGWSRMPAQSGRECCSQNTSESILLLLWLGSRPACSLEPYPSLQVCSWPPSQVTFLDADAIFHVGKHDASRVTVRQAGGRVIRVGGIVGCGPRGSRTKVGTTEPPTP